MKTKFQKVEEVKNLTERVKETNSLVVADFTGLAANAANTLRKSLATGGMKFRVVKKRLLKIIFQETGLAFDPTKMAGQLGVVFSPKDLVETAQTTFKFHKVSKNAFKLLGGAEIQTGKILSAGEIVTIGGLLGREVLIRQLVGLIAAPFKSLLFLMNERAKKGE